MGFEKIARFGKSEALAKWMDACGAKFVPEMKPQCLTNIKGLQYKPLKTDIVELSKVKTLPKGYSQIDNEYCFLARKGDVNMPSRHMVGDTILSKEDALTVEKYIDCSDFNPVGAFTLNNKLRGVEMFGEIDNYSGDIIKYLQNELKTSNPFDTVMKLDKMSEAEIIKLIKQRFPNVSEQSVLNELDWVKHGFVGKRTFYTKQINALDNLIKKSPEIEHESTVYRAIDLDENPVNPLLSINRFRNLLKNKEIYFEPAYTSTTTKPDAGYIKQFGGQWYFRIKLPKGTQGISVGRNYGRALDSSRKYDEFIIGRNSGFEINNIDENKKIIDMTLQRAG